MFITNILMNVILIFMLLSLFNLVRYMFKIRKALKMHKDNPNIKGFTIINGQIKPIEEKDGSLFSALEKEQGTPNEENAKEMVKDLVCGNEVEKKEAYRILKDGKEYFFCSWECREQFLNP